MDSRWIAFVVASTLVIAVPGPSVAFSVSRALALGRRRALAGVLGNATGVYVQALAVAVGLGRLVEESATAFTVIKFAGAAYLVLLGVTAIRHRRRSGAVATQGPVAPREAGRGVLRCLADGVAVGLLNPKTVVFFLAFLPPFLDPARSTTAQVAVLGAVFAAIAVLLDTGWVLTAGGARTWLARSPRRLAALDVTGGLAMVGVGVGVAVSGRPS